MSVFILMTRLSPETLASAEGRRTRGEQWLERIKAGCPEVKWLSHYTLLGPYDFMDIFEAPDAEVAHRVSLISRAEGALTAETWPAMPYERFLDQLRQVQG